MDQTNEHPNPQQDDRLADFADQVLLGKMKTDASPPTDDLLGLEETILRLNNSFLPASLDDAAVKQMHVRLKARIRHEEEKVKPSFWKKWFGREISPQLGLAFAVLAALVVMVLTSPSWIPSGSTTTGTATTPVNFIVVAGLVAVLFAVYWFTRRK